MMKKALLRVARAASRDRDRCDLSERTRKRSSVSETSLSCSLQREHVRRLQVSIFRIQHGFAREFLQTNGQYRQTNTKRWQLGHTATPTHQEQGPRTYTVRSHFHSSTKERPKEPFFSLGKQLKQFALTGIPDTAQQKGAELVGALYAQQILWLYKSHMRKCQAYRLPKTARYALLLWRPVGQGGLAQIINNVFFAIVVNSFKGLSEHCFSGSIQPTVSFL